MDFPVLCVDEVDGLESNGDNGESNGDPTVRDDTGK